MNICLIIPPSPYLLSDQAVPCLGPMWVAACLRNAGHKVEILDLTGQEKYIDLVKLHPGADCYGLTGTSQDYSIVLSLYNILRQYHKKSRLILGGAHATISPNECLKDGWDAVVAGDGFIAAARALTENGIIWASRVGETVSNIDETPFPARDLMDLDKYKFYVNGERTTSVMTSFGCPMGCNFCCGRNLHIYRKLRAFSPKRILREWDEIRANYPHFPALMDYADEWNIPSERAINLAEEIAKHSTKWLLRCCVKAEYFTDDVAKAMCKAGVVEVLCGVESGSDRILNVINKHTTWEINGRAREIARKYGIKFKALTMVGLPTETREDILKTKEWLLKFKPDDFDTTVYQPIKGSPIADRPDVEGRGLYFSSASNLPYKTAPGEYITKTHTDKLTSSDIVCLREEIDQDVRRELGLVKLVRSSESSMGQRTIK